MTRFFFTLVLAAALTLPPVSASSQPLDKVVYGTASRVGLANAAMYLAESMGFFREQRIAVETVQFDGTGVLLPQIANKSVTIGYPIPDVVILSHDVGKDPLPLKFFYNVTREYNWEIIVLRDSPIKSLADLRGKSIGVVALGTGNVPVTRAMLKSVGLEAGKDVDLVAIGQGPAAVNAFKTRRVDAFNQFDVVHATIEVQGTPIRRLPMPDDIRRISGNSFATHVDLIRDNPDLLRRFARAYTMGLIACDANPEGCVKMFWQFHPSAKPTGSDEAKAIADSVAIMNANMAKKLPPGSGCKRDFGRFDPLGWSTNVRVLIDNGMLKNPNVDLSKVYTNEFVADFGKFDCAAVIQKAKAIK